MALPRSGYVTYASPDPLISNEWVAKMGAQFIMSLLFHPDSNNGRHGRFTSCLQATYATLNFHHPSPTHMSRAVGYVPHGSYYSASKAVSLPHAVQVATVSSSRLTVTFQGHCADNTYHNKT
ncbi:hypothetical protein FS837_000858 [Tulasnella sp. UAMH 9824]|nr:hypothetical protein FS837_000858 [Tulasnella sp. UAMH 9824]